MANTRELSQLASVISVADETRNIGIGTTTPTSKLHVIGDVRVTGIITATSFSGNASNATYASIAGVSTVSENLTGSPNITVSSVNSFGIVTATSFSGSGTNLTGIVTSIIAGSNITISGSTGQVTINSSASGGSGEPIDILEVMLFA